MKYSLVLYVFLPVVVGNTLIETGEQKGPEDSKKLIEQINSGAEQARTVLEAFYKERVATVHALVSFVTENAPKREKRLVVLEVVKALGKLRSTEAIDVLLSNLLFEPNEIYSHPEPPSVRYPCVGALIEIGGPVIPGMMNLLASESNDNKKRYLAQWIIESILGGGKSTGWNDKKGKILTKALLEEEIGIERDELRKQHMRKVLDEVSRSLREK